ncbi:MAG: hypothetical protein H0U86_09110 [Chloroflexi bacterium]|nr:hypothetical protein [Chloroflexota bacterium]
MTNIRLAQEERERGFVNRLAQAVGEPSLPLAEAIRRLVGRRRADREQMVSLIETLVSSDDELRLVSGTVSSLLRSSLAAEDVRTALAGEAATLDADEEMLTPDDVLRVARVQGEAEASVLRHEVVEASALARLLGSTSVNPREFVRSLRTRGDVVGLPRTGGYLFPAFQVNARRREIWPIVAELNRLLGAKDDPWAVASWWFARDSRLTAEPCKLVSDPARADDLRRAAARELAAVG